MAPVVHSALGTCVTNGISACRLFKGCQRLKLRSEANYEGAVKIVCAFCWRVFSASYDDWIPQVYIAVHIMFHPWVCATITLCNDHMSHRIRPTLVLWNLFRPSFSLVLYGTRERSSLGMPPVGLLDLVGSLKLAKPTKPSTLFSPFSNGTRLCPTLVVCKSFWTDLFLLRFHVIKVFWVLRKQTWKATGTWSTGQSSFCCGPAQGAQTRILMDAVAEN